MSGNPTPGGRGGSSQRMPEMGSAAAKPMGGKRLVLLAPGKLVACEIGIMGSAAQPVSPAISHR